MKKNEVRRFGADFGRFWVDSGTLEKDEHRPELTWFWSELTLSEKIENYIFKISARVSSISIRTDSPVNWADSPANRANSIHEDSDND